MLKNFIPIVNHSLKYNPALDGLRGVAIALVLLFHIWPEYFSFGYIGVDIFFVLSGYLITQIIYAKLQASSFSLKEFYRNRIRRIFPALIVVLVATLIIGYLFLFPSELKELGKHIKSSAFFYENFRLINEVGYWDKAAVLKPLLHCWSLGIEEQFYIAWPFILVLLHKTKLNMVLSLFVLLLILFITPYVAEIDKFYHTLSRAWELALGGLAFIISHKHKNIAGALDKYRLVIYIGFFISILFSYNNSSFTIYKTFLIVFFSALLIISLSLNKSKTVFSTNILVFLGLISFPLYLWHYVIISFAHIFGFDIDISIGIIVATLSMILSYLTYRYIEIYARAQKSYLFAFSLLVVVIILGFLGNYISKNDGLPNRAHLKSDKKFEKQFIRTPAQNSLGVSLVTKVLGYKPTNDYIKSTSDNITKKYVAIVGDSHAHTSYPGFAQEFLKEGYESILLANSSCPPYLNGAMGQNWKDLNQCKRKIDAIYKLLNSKLNIKKIIFATRAPVYMYGLGYGKVDGGDKRPYSGSKLESFFINQARWNQKKEFLANIERTFKYFNKIKKIRFYYLMEDPELGFSPKNCIARPLNLFPNNCKLPLASYINRSREYRDFIYNLSKKYKNIKILDPKDIYCDNKYCYAIRDDKMLYADDDHHSIDGSIIQAKYFIKSIDAK